MRAHQLQAERIFQIKVKRPARRVANEWFGEEQERTKVKREEGEPVSRAAARRAVFQSRVPLPGGAGCPSRVLVGALARPPEGGKEAEEWWLEALGKWERDWKSGSCGHRLRWGVVRNFQKKKYPGRIMVRRGVWRPGWECLCCGVVKDLSVERWRCIQCTEEKELAEEFCAECMGEPREELVLPTKEDKCRLWEMFGTLGRKIHFDPFAAAVAVLARASWSGYRVGSFDEQVNRDCAHCGKDLDRVEHWVNCVKVIEASVAAEMWPMVDGQLEKWFKIARASFKDQIQFVLVLWAVLRSSRRREPLKGMLVLAKYRYGKR